MKKVFKFLSVGLIAGIMTGTFAGCGSAGGNTNKIGMVVSTLDNPFFVNLKAVQKIKLRNLDMN